MILGFGFFDQKKNINAENYTSVVLQTGRRRKRCEKQRELLRGIKKIRATTCDLKNVRSHYNWSTLQVISLHNL